MLGRQIQGVRSITKGWTPSCCLFQTGTETQKVYLRKWREAVGGTRGIRNNHQIAGIILVVHTKHKDWGVILWRCRQHNFLSTTFEMTRGGLLGKEGAGRFTHIPVGHQSVRNLTCEVLKREATHDQASGLQGLTGSSGTRAGDTGREKKMNQDLENSGMIQD